MHFHYLKCAELIVDVFGICEFLVGTLLDSESTDFRMDYFITKLFKNSYDHWHERRMIYCLNHFLGIVMTAEPY